MTASNAGETGQGMMILYILTEEALLAMNISLNVLNVWYYREGAKMARRSVKARD